MKKIFLSLMFLTGCLAPVSEESKELNTYRKEELKVDHPNNYQDGPAGCGLLSQEFEIIIDGKVNYFSITLPCDNKWQDPSDPADIREKEFSLTQEENQNLN